MAYGLKACSCHPLKDTFQFCRTYNHGKNSWHTWCYNYPHAYHWDWKWCMAWSNGKQRFLLLSYPSPTPSISVWGSDKASYNMTQINTVLGGGVIHFLPNQTKCANLFFFFFHMIVAVFYPVQLHSLKGWNRIQRVEIQIKSCNLKNQKGNNIEKKKKQFIVEPALL